MRREAEIKLPIARNIDESVKMKRQKLQGTKVGTRAAGYKRDGEEEKMRSLLAKHAHVYTTPYMHRRRLTGPRAFPHRPPLPNGLVLMECRAAAKG